MCQCPFSLFLCARSVWRLCFLQDTLFYASTKHLLEHIGLKRLGKHVLHMPELLNGVTKCLPCCSIPLQNFGQERILQALWVIVFRGLVWKHTAAQLSYKVPNRVVHAFLSLFCILLSSIFLKNNLKCFHQFLIGKNIFFLKVVLSPQLMACSERWLVDIHERLSCCLDLCT